MKSGEASFGVGLVGFGSHTRRVLLPALTAAALRPVAVCTSSAATAEVARARTGARRRYSSVDAFVGEHDRDVEGIVVAVPREACAAAVGRCLDAGVPIFVEKPAAATAAEAAALASDATARGIPVVVGFMKRFVPAYRALRDGLSRGDFGDDVSLHVELLVGPLRESGVTLPSLLREVAVHVFDLARWLAGDFEVAIATAGGTPPVATVVAAAPAGQVVLSVGAASSWRHVRERVRVAGGARVAEVADGLQVRVHDGDRPVEVWGPPALSTPAAVDLTGFAPELDRFRRVIAGGAPGDAAGLDDAAAALAVAEVVEDRLAGRSRRS